MSEFEEFSTLATEYFRILHEGDTEAIEQLFLPQCNLIFPNDDGSISSMTRDEYISVVAARESPKSLGHPRYGSLLMADHSSSNTALIKVECAVQPNYFLDYLTLVKEMGQWKIAAKIFCVTEQSGL